MSDNVEKLILSGDATSGIGNDSDNYISGSSSTSTLSGGAGDDTLIGSSNQNGVYLNGGVGNDSLVGGSGDDTLIGGYGIDTMIGSAGNDIYYVDNTSDIITEGAGNGTDTAYSSATYTLSSNMENLTLIGTSEIDGTGNTLDNIITGNSANNIIDGGIGADTMLGGVGDDSYYVDNEGDIVTENSNEGTDKVYSSISYTLTENVENLTLSGEDSINGSGNDLDNVITGNSGNNVLVGNAGADTMLGGEGDDSYYVDNINDIVTENSGEGTDTVHSSVSYTLSNNAENLILEGTDSINAYGNDLDNEIIGNLADNIIDGDTGADTMLGGDGNDTYYVDNTGDVVTENTDEGIDLVSSSISYTLVNNVENLTLSGTENLTGTGNELDNVITGNNGDNTLSGGIGDDTLIGGIGSDTMIGGVGNDDYYVDSSGDIVSENSDEGEDTVYSEIDYTLTDNVEELILTGTDSISGAGNDLDNTITGNLADNVIDGSIGADSMTGGDGNDTYYVDNTGDVITENTDEGIDAVYSSVSYTLSDNVENLILADTDTISGTGNSLDNYITGNSAENVLTAEAGTDTLDGGIGADTMIGGTGNDTYYVDNIGDVITENIDEGTDLVSSSVTYALSSNVENLFLSGNNSINGTGNSLDNIITGNSGDNILTGNTGSDMLLGGDGNDTYSFSAEDGIDEITDTAGNDFITFDSSVSIDNLYYLQNGDNLIIRNRTNSDEIIIDNWYLSADNQIETMSFSGGTQVSIDPTANTIINETIDEDNTLTLDVLDDYNGQLIIDSITQGTNGTVIIDENNELVYTPNANYNGVDSFTYTLSDGNGGTVTKTVDLTINSINDAPTATLTSATLDEDDSVVLDVLANASDVDEDTLSISNYTQGTNGTITTNEYDQLVYMPDANYNGTDSFTYTLSDGNGGTVTKTVDLTINSINDAPTSELTSATLDEDSSVILDVLASANDVDEDTLSISDYSQGTNGAVTINENDEIVYTPNTHYSGSDSFTYTISDGNGGTVTKTLNLTINPLPINITGDSSNNLLNGNYKDNIIDGGAGADTMIGGTGNDTYYVDNTGDVVTEDSGEGTDLVSSSVTYTLGSNVENLILSGNDSINGTGNDLDNYITGNSGANTLTGNGGADTLEGSSGDDTMVGGSGNDTYNFSSGNDSDQISDAAGTDSILFDSSVSKTNIAMYIDSNNNLIIDYGSTGGQDVINIQNQSINTIEQVRLSDGEYMTDSDINALIQNMTAYAANNSIEFNCVSDVKDNQDLMTMVANSWHG